VSRLKWLLPLAVLALGVVVVALILSTEEEVQSQQPDVPVPLVRVLPVEVGPVTLQVRTHGTVAPRTESALVPEVSGTVTWTSPELVSGGFFEEGEPLLRVDRSDYEVAVARARATLARTRSEAERAERELARQRTLAERDVASPARLDDAETAARVAEAAVAEARAALRQTERDLARTEIRAPFPGRVRSEQVDVGQFVSRGQTLATLYAVDYAEVRLPIADEELAHVDVPLLRRRLTRNGEPPGEAGGTGEGAAVEAASGPRVELRADFAGERHTWVGRVVRTEGEIDPRSHMVHVVARVDDPYGRAARGGRPPLAVGLFVEARIRGRHLEEAVVLPREALRADDARAQDSPAGDAVWIVDAEDRLRIRPVRVVRRAEDDVVIGAGLEPGDRVVVSALSSVVDGMPVRAVPAEEAAPAAPETAATGEDAP